MELLLLHNKFGRPVDSVTGKQSAAQAQVERTLYLINPREQVAGYYSLDVIEAWTGAGRVTNVVDLTTPTVAALVPEGWRIEICDERVQPVDLDHRAAVIGITGKVSQRSRMIELADEFRGRGKLVVVGGPYVSLNPADLVPHADIVVQGEIEEIAAGLFDDIAAGTWRRSYTGTQPDLTQSPPPRWDLYPLRAGLAAQVQTSRGCPFECEFCDVIQYLGRKQRWKEPVQVVEELEMLYAAGFRDVLLADDNLTVMRRRARALLEAIRDWNGARPGGRMRFSSQISVDIARDGAMLELAAQAGLTMAFVGIETPNEASLAETHKRQNLRVDLAEEVTRIVNAGIMVVSGMIVGFDNDDETIFERQLAFAERLPVPLITAGLLVAPHATPLYARLQKEGRLVESALDHIGAGNMFRTNIVPLRMSARTLEDGARGLLLHLYRPAVFLGRLKLFVENSPARHEPQPRPFFAGPVENALARGLMRLNDPDEPALLRFLQETTARRPELRAQLQYCFLQYCQTRRNIEEIKLYAAPAPA